MCTVNHWCSASFYAKHPKLEVKVAPNFHAEMLVQKLMFSDWLTCAAQAALLIGFSCINSQPRRTTIRKTEYLAARYPNELRPDLSLAPVQLHVGWIEMAQPRVSRMHSVSSIALQ